MAFQLQERCWRLLLLIVGWWWWRSSSLDDAASSTIQVMVMVQAFAPFSATIRATTRQNPQWLGAAPPKKLSEADKDRLLLSETALAAFIVAEMQHFTNTTMMDLDLKQSFGVRWQMSQEDKLQAGILAATAKTETNEDGDTPFAEYSVDPDYLQATHQFAGFEGGQDAVKYICNLTDAAFHDGYQQTGLLSALGSAILYFRDHFRTPTALAACERIGLSDYQVAHHITDMYHHRTLRGTYTKTLTPSGLGEVAAQKAVGLWVDETKGEATATSAKQKPAKNSNNPNKDDSTASQSSSIEEEEDLHIDDECLLWSPTTPNLCLHWKSDDEHYRKTRRFEKIQMEGTRDPRRGGSGTTR